MGRMSKYRIELEASKKAGTEGQACRPVDEEILKRHEWFATCRQIVGGQRLQLSRRERSPTPEEMQTWRALLHRLYTRCIDPYVFIRVQFEPSPGEPAPLITTPRQLLSESCVERYADYLQDPSTLRSRKIRLATESASLNRKIDFYRYLGGLGLERATLVVLRENIGDLSLLFRYCFARRAANLYSEYHDAFCDLATELCVPATLEFVRYHTLVDQTVLGGVVPADFREAAPEIYRRYVTVLFHGTLEGERAIEQSCEDESRRVPRKRKRAC